MAEDLSSIEVSSSFKDEWLICVGLRISVAMRDLTIKDEGPICVRLKI